MAGWKIRRQKWQKARARNGNIRAARIIMTKSSSEGINGGGGIGYIESAAGVD